MRGISNLEWRCDVHHAAGWIRPLLPIVFPLVLLGCASADFCVRANKPDLPSIDIVFAGKGFALPASGQCAAWSGFCQSGCSVVNVQAGTACAASDGTHVQFGITTFYWFGGRQWDSFQLELPGLTGFGAQNTLKDGTPLTIHYSTSVVACTPPVVPVP